MEITKFLTIPKLLFSILTMAILNLFILDLVPSSEPLQLPSTYFQLNLLSKYLLLLAFFRTFNCCLLTFCIIFKLPEYHL
jgi:hypothetical protein